MRGFYAGLGSKPVVDYIKSLGVTTVELMPIHTFIDDDYLLEKKLKNYWGYNSIGFFAPDPRYASDVPNSLREFKEMIARLHDGGLEVILDVVYNHTAEGNERGATLSFKGIDNKSYYRLMPDEPRFYINDTGTGNTLNLSHPRVIQMVADSLRYWVSETRVDGFRFDLGTILAREPDGFNTESGFLKVVGQDPVLADVKLIAEPWDLGPGGYQVGGFPPGWGEWNDRFRDDVRDFWRGHGDAKALAPRLCASPDKFNFRGRRPWASVNFIAAHDGFTLNDLVSYNDKHNEANGEDNRDGSSDNRSWNCGAEGPTEDPAINALRERQIRSPRENFKSIVVHYARAPLTLALGPHTSRPNLLSAPNDLFLGRRCGSTEDNGGHKSASTSALHFTNVPVARECLANKGLIVRKPNSGSARHRWARENSKHRRTATRQRGFCSSFLKQGPLDMSKTGVTPENGPLEIVRKAASLRAPT